MYKHSYKSLQKEHEMSQYKNKWGMTRYRFFCYQNKYWDSICKKSQGYCLEIYPSDSTFIPDRSNGLNEIKALPTLINRVQCNMPVRLYTGPFKLPSYYGENTAVNYIEFENFNKFKEYTLIEKLGITNFER